jgi:hypothetical protein
MGRNCEQFLLPQFESAICGVQCRDALISRLVFALASSSQRKKEKRLFCFCRQSLSWANMRSTTACFGSRECNSSWSRCRANGKCNEGAGAALKALGLLSPRSPPTRTNKIKIVEVFYKIQYKF